MIRPQTCPICDKQLAADAALKSNDFPFCSERCRQIDLYRWSEGKYAITQPLRPDDLLDEDLAHELEEKLREQMEQEHPGWE